MRWDNLDKLSVSYLSNIDKLSIVPFNSCILFFRFFMFCKYISFLYLNEFSRFSSEVIENQIIIMTVEVKPNNKYLGIVFLFNCPIQSFISKFDG